MVTPEHFVDPNNRDVFVGLKEALKLVGGPGGREAVLAELRYRASGGAESAPLFARLVMEADRGKPAAAALELLHLRLQEQYYVRQVNALQGKLEGGDRGGRGARAASAFWHLLDTIQGKHKTSWTPMLIDPDMAGGESEGAHDITVDARAGCP